VVGDEARSERAYRYPRDKVTNQRRCAQAIGNESEEECQGETDGEGRDERHIMRHEDFPLS
jgi:hypothetical protein